MVYELTDLNSWPLRENFEPVFRTTNDALFYAQLIWNLPAEKENLAIYKDETHKALKLSRESNAHDFDHMMILATRAQFFRECLEECKRIEEEKLNNGQVQKPQ